MGREGVYKEGEHLFICDICGLSFYSGVKRIMWDNKAVDPKCFEIRHPQDFVRGVKDDQTIDEGRPRSGNAFLEAGDVTTTDFDPNLAPEDIPALVFLGKGDVTPEDL